MFDDPGWLIQSVVNRRSLNPFAKRTVILACLAFRRRIQMGMVHAILAGVDPLAGQAKASPFARLFFCLSFVTSPRRILRYSPRKQQTCRADRMPTGNTALQRRVSPCGRST